MAMTSRNVWSYVAALAIAAMAVAARALLDPVLHGHHPLALLYAAIAASIVLAGLGPSILAALVGYVASDILFFSPRGDFTLRTAVDWTGFAMYLVSVGIIIFLGASLRQSRRELRARVVELNRDVAERRRIEAAEADARAQLEILVETMAAPVTRCDRSLRYLWVSRGYAEWLGRPSAEIIGSAIVDVLGDAAFLRLRSHFERVLAGETVRFEEEVEFKTLGRRWIQATFTPTRAADGEVDGWVGVEVDLDPQKRAEERLREADRRKNEFLAILAHELRNPLAPIRNAVRYLRVAGPPQRDLEDAREIIDRQVDQMTRLVNDLLELSRITQGMVEVRKARIELAPVVRTAIDGSRPLIQARGHELIVSLPEEPVWLEADPVRLGQVLSNLLQNAAKYTAPGGRIWLTADREGREIVFTVRDTGIGIAPEHLNVIFDMFTQSRQGDRSVEGGLGIGLALVRGLVELHGGTVEARSDGVAHGSEFVVRLPAPPSRGSHQGLPGEIGASAAGAAQRKVLVVDDNRDSTESMRMLLSLHGHDVRTAYDGVHALAEVDAFHPDVVLLDIGLPRMDGYEVARAIRERPGGAKVLLVAVTGWGLEEDRKRAQEAGFDHHLTKPADLDALDAVLRTADSNVEPSTAS